MNENTNVSRITGRIFKGTTEPHAGIAATVGLIVLSTDEVGADAFTSLMPRTIRTLVTRTAYDDDEATGEFQIRDSYKAVADEFPRGDRLDILAFSCTSATVATGKERLLNCLSGARPGIKYTSPGIAGHKALHHIGARRVALLTPYGVNTHKAFLPFFHLDGFEVVSDGTFNKDTDEEIGELTRTSLFDAAHELVEGQSADALFVSCTATPIVPHIEELERELKIPVISSSQAMAWDVLRMVGYNQSIEGYGELMRLSGV
ncbi:maleate cis-trans isomerase family protein [Rhizobium azibense]|uniref:Maleate isomerase n=1 Tax=Rhizobium azibense TaxID=1136135 RepID=A0A4R3RDC3_9HYPH|nr:aspartate/glutamate racemase family protein [Rhizobium azibense]TCU31312.1 maleate isomerase [Rhizobium azibense]